MKAVLNAYNRNSISRMALNPAAVSHHLEYLNVAIIPQITPSAVKAIYAIKRSGTFGTS